MGFPYSDRIENGQSRYGDYEEGHALLEDRCKKYAEED